MSGGDDRAVRVWDLETRAAVQTFEELDGSVNVAKFHTDGGWICSRLNSTKKNETGLEQQQPETGAAQLLSEVAAMLV